MAILVNHDSFRWHGPLAERDVEFLATHLDAFAPGAAFHVSRELLAHFRTAGAPRSLLVQLEASLEGGDEAEVSLHDLPPDGSAPGDAAVVQVPVTDGDGAAIEPALLALAAERGLVVAGAEPGAHLGEQYVAAGAPLACLVCAHDRFAIRRAQLVDRVSWTGDRVRGGPVATCVTCTRCGYVHWFAPVA